MISQSVRCRRKRISIQRSPRPPRSINQGDGSTAELGDVRACLALSRLVLSGAPKPADPTSSVNSSRKQTVRTFMTLDLARLEISESERNSTSVLLGSARVQVWPPPHLMIAKESGQLHKSSSAVFYPQLRVSASQVILHRLYADTHDHGNLRVGLALK